MTQPSTSRRRERPKRPIERAEILIIIVLAIVGALWGAAWQRSAVLTDIASVAPIMMVVIGPGALVTYLAYRVAKGEFELRMDGYGTLVLLAAALAGNVLTPRVLSSISMSGHVTGTLDGATLNGSARCVWGAGREAVVSVWTDLPELIPPAAGSTQGSFTSNLPTGTLQITLPGGAVTLTYKEDTATRSLPLRNESGGIGSGDRAKGSITLDTAKAALVAGDVSWSCDPPPAN